VTRFANASRFYLRDDIFLDAQFTVVRSRQ